MSSLASTPSAHGLGYASSGDHRTGDHRMVLRWTGAVLLFAALSATLVVVGRAELIEWLYPAAALAGALALYRSAPGTFLAYTWLIVFFTPEVRRVVDWLTGWSATSPIMLAPILVPGVAMLALLRHAHLLRLRAYAPFGLALLGIGYGYLVGVAKVGVAAASFDVLNWAVPVGFGFYTVLHWRRYAEQRDALVRAFAWGLVLMGVYAVVQFVLAPPWDGYWMENATMSSIGTPEPFQIRVFSTMNSPGPFGSTVAAGLLLLMGARGRGGLRWAAIALGSAGLLLSMVRTAWLSLILGVVVLVLLAPRGQRGRMLGALVGLGVVAALATAVLPSGDVMVERMGSMGNLQEDHSFQARLNFWGVVSQSFTDPVGGGMGSAGVAAKLTAGDTFDFDNGIANVPFVLGWPGGIAFTLGVMLLTLRACRTLLAARARGAEPFPVAALAVALSILAMMVSSNMLLGMTGMLFWSGLGLVLAWAWPDATDSSDA